MHAMGPQGCTETRDRGPTGAQRVLPRLGPLLPTSPPYLRPCFLGCSELGVENVQDRLGCDSKFLRKGFDCRYANKTLGVQVTFILMTKTTH